MAALILATAVCLLLNACAGGPSTSGSETPTLSDGGNSIDASVPDESPESEGPDPSSDEVGSTPNATILATYGRQEIYLSPNGQYGFVQASSDEPQCLQPVLEAKEVCFDESGPRFELQPRWDLAGTRMTFASSENPDFMISNAATGAAMIPNPDEPGTERYDEDFQLAPNWLGSRLVGFRGDGPMTMVDTDGNLLEGPGSLVDPKSAQAITPPLSLGTGGILVARTPDTLEGMTRDERQSYPFPDATERRSSRPGPSALRPPLIPIGMSSDGRAVVADSLPAAARKTGMFGATSGAYLLDLDTGEYSPVFLDGTDDGIAQVAVGVSNDGSALVFLWADDNDPRGSVMRLSTARFEAMPIDPRTADVLYEAEPGVVLAGSDALNPLVWTATNQTAFRIDGDWAHIQLPERASQSGLDTAISAAAEAALIDFFVDYRPEPTVVQCIRSEVDTVGTDDLLASLSNCGGRIVNRNASDLLATSALNKVDALIGLIPDPGPALRDCMVDVLLEIGAQETTVAAVRCDPSGFRAMWVDQLGSAEFPQTYKDCLIAGFARLQDSQIEGAALAAGGDQRQAGANVAELLIPHCTAELTDGQATGPRLVDLIESIEAYIAPETWEVAGPFTQDGVELVLLTHSDGTEIGIASSPTGQHVLSVEIVSSTPLGPRLAEDVLASHFELSLPPQGFSGTGQVRSGGSEFRLCYDTLSEPQNYLILWDDFDCT